jgi:hypothetical protein
MKTKPILIALFLAPVASSALASVDFWPWTHPTPTLAFRTEGGQLTASLPLHINNSAAVIDTSIVLDHKEKTVTLGFVVIQNPDLYRRSTRQIDVEWQLGGIRQEDYAFKIEGSTVALRTERLKTLLPQETAVREEDGDPAFVYTRMLMLGTAETDRGPMTLVSAQKPERVPVDDGTFTMRFPLINRGGATQTVSFVVNQQDDRTVEVACPPTNIDRKLEPASGAEATGGEWINRTIRGHKPVKVTKHTWTTIFGDDRAPSGFAWQVWWGDHGPGEE